MRVEIENQIKSVRKDQCNESRQSFVHSNRFARRFTKEQSFLSSTAIV